MESKQKKEKKDRNCSVKKIYKCEMRELFFKNFQIESNIKSKNYNKKNSNKKNKSLEKKPDKRLEELNEIKRRLICASRNIDFEKKRKIITIVNKDKNIEEKAEYIEEGELGKGAFGVCYLYESTKDWTQYAAKIVSKEKLSKDKSRQSIIEEITTQQQLNSPKIVKVKSYSEDKENVYIILELCKNRSLADLVKKKHYLTEYEVRNYMFQIIQGVRYLRSQKIIHRDLKPNNIFLDEKLELKIGDFGLIAKMNKEKERKHTICGTPAYMAPEVIDNNKKGYSYEVDIWSIGVIMYNLLTGTLPFHDSDKIKLQEKILKGKFSFPNNIEISNIAKDLIKQILVIEPRKRPGLNQILYHDFFHVEYFPKFLPLSTLEEPPKKEEKEEKEEEPSIKYLYKLIVNDIPDIKYENLEKYTLKKTPKVKKN